VTKCLDFSMCETEEMEVGETRRILRISESLNNPLLPFITMMLLI